MFEALDDHEGSVSIGGRPLTNFRFADDIIVNAEAEEEAGVLVDRLDTTTTRYKMEIGPDKISDDKHPKWLPQRDQDKRSVARRSGELEVPWSNHLQRRVKTRDDFQDSLDNSSSFWTEDHMEGQEHLACF